MRLREVWLVCLVQDETGACSAARWIIRARWRCAGGLSGWVFAVDGLCACRGGVGRVALRGVPRDAGGDASRGSLLLAVVRVCCTWGSAAWQCGVLAGGAWGRAVRVWCGMPGSTRASVFVG